MIDSTLSDQSLSIHTVNTGTTDLRVNALDSPPIFACSRFPAILGVELASDANGGVC